MTEQISHAVESIKLAYLSHTSVVWLVTGEKEVASEIVEQFTIEHFGAFRNSDVLGCPVYLHQLTNKSINDLSKDKTLKEYLDKPLKDFIGKCNIKHFSSISSDAANTPSVFYLWQTNNDKDVMKSIENFVTVHGFMNAEFDVQSKTPEHIRTVHLSLAIIASPTPPPASWLTQYIEVVYVKPLQNSEIQKLILDRLSSKGIEFEDEYRLRQLVVNLRGFSGRKISQTIARCILSGFFDNKHTQWSKILCEIRFMKRQMLDGFVGLKWVDVQDDKYHETVTREQLKVSGGLEVISRWLNDRKDIFADTEKAQKSGYDIPKGVLITGIPGTGKSMMAKETARILDLPLIALDLGDLQEGLVGASEEHMAQALRKVEAMAPCVLWIDEIEKAFSGSNSGSSDGGVMRRMFGKFLTWMQEKTATCFVFATSNDISELPPEIFRSERFDDKFFSFMPMVDECAEIFGNLITQENKKYRNNNPNDELGNLFSIELTRPSVWKNFLNDYINRKCRVDMDENKWKDGKVPQCKLLTGADISMLVKLLKFKLLKNKPENVTTNFPKKLVLETVEEELDKFMPYGQTNLKDIVICFRKLSLNRFKSASSSCIINFDDYNVETEEMCYDTCRYVDEYDKTLYATVVGAINFYKESKDKNSHENSK